MHAFYAHGRHHRRPLDHASAPCAVPSPSKPERTALCSTPSSARAVEAGLHALYERTLAVLEENRIEVLCVANALEVNRTITGDDVAAVVDGETGSLVDGRPYQDPVFRQQLLDYHEAAVQAHREHAKVAGVPPRCRPRSRSYSGSNGHRQGAGDLADGAGDRRRAVAARAILTRCACTTR